MNEYAVVADISERLTRWSLVEMVAGDKPVFLCSADLAGGDYDCFEDMLTAFLDRIPEGLSPSMLGASMAGPVVGDILRPFYHDWTIDRRAILDRFGFDAFHPTNSVSGIASAVPWLAQSDYEPLGDVPDGTPDFDNGSYAVLRVGNGIGCAGLTCKDGEVSIIASETGHTSYAPRTAREMAVAARVIAANGFTSNEAMLSLGGLQTLYREICQLDGRVPGTLNATEIILYGRTGADPVCAEALDMVMSGLGGLASDACLNFCSIDGVFMEGELFQKAAEGLPADTFRRAFEDKGRFGPFVTAVPTYVISNRSAGLLGVARLIQSKWEADLEARKRKQSAEQTLSDITSCLDQGVIVMDASLDIVAATGRVWYDAPAREQMLAPGRPLRPFLEQLGRAGQLPDDMDAEALFARIEARETFSFERALLGGRVFTCDVYPRSGGGVVMIETDRTELRRRTDELEQLTCTLRAEKDRSDDASRAKSEFVANMSHEIRTPLNGVLGMADVLSRTKLEETQQEMLSVISSSGNGLLTVINDILDFSKIEAGKMRLVNAPFDLRSCIEDVASLLAAEADRKGLELMVRFEPGLPEHVFGDGGRIRQILTNLVGNAIKFTREGHVLIGVERTMMGTKPAYRILVEDTGCGIPEDKLSSVFEVFEQADGSSTRQHEGTGLGLSISTRLVELMGGNIDASSEVDKGSTFVVTVDLPTDEKSASACVAASEVELEGCRVLVVDDIEVNQRIVAEQLASWNVETVCVDGAAEAFAVLEEEHAAGRSFDAAILDFQMPQMDGLTLAAELKDKPHTEALPLILLTSVGHVGDAPNFDKHGFASYLVKPAKRDALARALRTALSGGTIETGRLGKPMRVAPVSETAGIDDLVAEEIDDIEEGADPLKILVAEDNRVNRLVIDSMLRNGGYEIEMADDGQAAVERFTDRRPDIVLMDVSMPRLDGLEATKQIRALEEGLAPADRTRIIGITAHALPEDRQRCLDSGMDDYLSKPVGREELIAAIRRQRRAS